MLLRMFFLDSEQIKIAIGLTMMFYFIIFQWRYGY